VVPVAHEIVEEESDNYHEFPQNSQPFKYEAFSISSTGTKYVIVALKDSPYEVNLPIIWCEGKLKGVD
jgi:hypothetical protein